MSSSKKPWFNSDFDAFGDDTDDEIFLKAADSIAEGDVPSKMKRSSSGPDSSLTLSSPSSSAAARLTSFGTCSATTTSNKSGSKFYRGASVDEQLFKRKKRATVDLQLWSLKHKPKSANDLAVHPKKIEEVRQWLKMALSSPQSPKVLVMTGPSGCGKTATLKTLCKEMRVDVQEWHNPTTIYDEGLPYEPQTEAFKRFVSRAIKYRALLGDHSINKKLVLIEEVPAFLLKDPGLLHQALERFRVSAPWPLVIIHSESQQKKSDTKRLYPPEILAKLSHISFNPIASTNLVKALSAIAMIESSYGVRSFKIPEKAIMTSLAASVNGDVRAAINALQFACLNEGDYSQCFELKNAKNSSKKRIKANGGVSKASSVGEKDASFDLFHAMGKVLYCKRHLDLNLEPHRLAAKHQKSKAREPLQSSPVEVFDKCPIGTDSFTCFLHQNYLDFFDDMNQTAEAAEYFSSADPFFKEWTTAGKIDLTHYGGLTSVLGLCNPRPNPVKVGGYLKTFSKPEFYGAVAKTNSRLPIISEAFLDRRLSNAETVITLAPLIAKSFKLVNEPKGFQEAVSFFPVSSLKRLEISSVGRILDEDDDAAGQEDRDDDHDIDFLIEDFD